MEQRGVQDEEGGHTFTGSQSKFSFRAAVDRGRPEQQCRGHRRLQDANAEGHSGAMS